MIVGVTKAEKSEREKEHAKQKATPGYDPGQWICTGAKIRDEEHYNVEYDDLKLITPTQGNHRFAYCQDLYEEVHVFLSKRKWAPVKTDVEVAGTTWIELFALFDLTGNRSVLGQHHKEPGAIKRAQKRMKKVKCARNKMLHLSETTVVSKPSFDEEIKTFKAVVRHIAKYERGARENGLVPNGQQTKPEKAQRPRGDRASTGNQSILSDNGTRKRKDR